MKKNTPLKFLVLAMAISGIFIAGSCVKTDQASCTSGAESPILKVEGADTSYVNQADTLKITYLVLNSCGKQAVVSPSVATQSTSVHINMTYDGCVCTMVAYQKTIPYVFKAPNVGTYTLGFWGGNDTTVITKTIVVKP